MKDFLLHVYKKGKWQECTESEDGVYVVVTQMISFLILWGNNSTENVSLLLQRCKWQ